MRMMNRLIVAAAVSGAALTLTGCGSSGEAEQPEAYFDPIPFQVEPPAAVVPPPVFSPSVNPTIVRLVRDQNDRIRDLMRQVAEITDQQSLVAESMAHADSLGQVLAQADTMPDEALLAIMEDQNSRLTGAVEKMQIATDHHLKVERQLTLYQESEYTPQKGPKPSMTYVQALALVQSREYARAATAFQSLLNGGVDRRLADDCYFWLGVSQFQVRNLSDAVRAFSRVLDFRMSSRREATYLMLGQCYEQLGSPKLAKATFERGVKEFPNGQMRKLAERMIALLN